MSNLLWKKKEKRNENQNKNKKLQNNENGEKEKKKRKRKEGETWTLFSQHWEKKRKKERTDIFSKIDSTSLHRLKKKRRKENWTFLNCDCNIVLTCCKVKIFEFEFKGDIRNFFSCSYYEILRKPLTEDFILGLMIFEIILILKLFFLEFGVFVE